MPQWLEDGTNGLTNDFRALLADLANDLRYLDDRIADLDERIEASVKKDPVAQRSLELRGVGPLTASALAGALGDGRAFSKGPGNGGIDQMLDSLLALSLQTGIVLCWSRVFDLYFKF